jgi:aconitate hydratase
LALSFERIHRSNLIGMGILPLRLPQGLHPQVLDVQPGDRIQSEAHAADLRPRSPVPFQILRKSGAIESYTAVAAVETQLEVGLLRAGGVIPSILQSTLAQNPGVVAAGQAGHVSI